MGFASNAVNSINAKINEISQEKRKRLAEEVENYITQAQGRLGSKGGNEDNSLFVAETTDQTKKSDRKSLSPLMDLYAYTMANGLSISDPDLPEEYAEIREAMHEAVDREYDFENSESKTATPDEPKKSGRKSLSPLMDLYAYCMANEISISDPDLPEEYAEIREAMHEAVKKETKKASEGLFN